MAEGRRAVARKAGGEEYEKKRKTILDAAAAVFKEKGYHAANSNDIARRAGMRRASIYYYYSGKKEIFRDMVGSAEEENVLMAERIAAGKDFPAQKLRKLIEGLFSSYARHYPYLFVYVQEDMTRLLNDRSAWSKKMRSLEQRFDRAMIRIIQDGVDDGSFETTANTRWPMMAIIGMCNWSHRWFDPERMQDGKEIATVFSDLVLDGLVTRKIKSARPQKP